MSERALAPGIDPGPDIAAWLSANTLTVQQMDCITAIVLKELDRKCKMDAGKQAVIMSIYEHLPRDMTGLFSIEVYHAIDIALVTPDDFDVYHIHQYRLLAEAGIPRPVMKAFKKALAETLFSET